METTYRYLGLSAVLLACGSPPSSPPDAAPPIVTRNLAVVRLESWPAGGRELTVRVQDDAGDPMAGDQSDRFEVTGAGEPVPFSVAPVALSPGYTAVLVAPAPDPAGRAEQMQALDELIAARPPGERIALYRWGETVDQVAGFTLDRARLSRVASVLAEPPDSAQLSAAAAVSIAGAEVTGVGGIGPRTMRALVVIAPGDAPAELAEMPVSAAPVLWVDGAGVFAAAARIDELAQGAHYTISLCGPTAATTVSLTIGDEPLEVPLPSTLPEETSGSCDPAAIGPGKRTYSDRIELVFTAAQRAVYDERVAANSKADFDLSLRLAPGQDLVTAVGHLRGAGSLACRRRSYTIDIDGPRRRHLFPGSATDEIYLLSMCPDDRYVNQYTANQLMAELGMFPIAFRYVEVSLDGVSQGVYLMLEKVREELTGDNGRVRVVARRRFAAPDDYFELKWQRPGVSGGVAPLDALMAALAQKSGAELASAAESATDLDAYLEFVALQTLLGNGDYVDETWYWSTDARGPGGAAGEYFETMAWDADDLFSECHYGGAYAFVDPNQLAFCAEARLDHILLGDPVTYGRYVDVLEQLLINIPPARFDAALAVTFTDIEPFLSKPGLCTAMIRLYEDNPGVSDPTECKRDVQAKLDSMAASFLARHAQLSAAVASYRGQ